MHRSSLWHHWQIEHAFQQKKTFENAQPARLIRRGRLFFDDEKLHAENGAEIRLFDRQFRDLFDFVLANPAAKAKKTQAEGFFRCPGLGGHPFDTVLSSYSRAMHFVGIISTMLYMI